MELSRHRFYTHPRWNNHVLQPSNQSNRERDEIGTIYYRLISIDVAPKKTADAQANSVDKPLSSVREQILYLTVRMVVCSVEY